MMHRAAIKKQDRVSTSLEFLRLVYYSSTGDRITRNTRHAASLTSWMSGPADTLRDFWVVLLLLCCFASSDAASALHNPSHPGTPCSS
eukprot:scaffold310015_cov18-Tisochrysis_lutea.AAC.1